MGIYELKVKTRTGEEFDLKNLKGKVSLVVNTATGCGFTPQYEAIEKLYEKYHEKGFEVLDFPCDQFGHQAPGTDDEIHEFCTAKYNTKFDQFAKIEVNGENESPVFTVLKEQQPKEEPEGMKNKMTMKAVKKMSKTCEKDGDIVWNFTKFLVDKDGNAIRRYDPTFDPAKIEGDLIKALE
ncbi:glutathione peroxidase [Candidatus Saccharibacteria bacterium]|nr:glutathione peroxidase [Candidatus Saccharibacteria bacterium]